MKQSRSPWKKGLEEIDGITHTREEWCELYGIESKAVYNRTHNLGWLFKDAIISNAPQKLVKIYGARKTRKAWSEFVQTDMKTIKNLMYNRQMSFQAAIKHILGNRLLLDSMTAKINGETKTLREWAEINGTPERVVINRLEKEVAREEAVMAVNDYQKLIIKRANANREIRKRNRYAKGAKEASEPMKQTDFEMIDFCLRCEKDAEECRGDVMKCMRERLILEYLAKDGATDEQDE